MDVQALNWSVLVLAVLAANLPFLNQQLFGVVVLSKSPEYNKPVWVRLIELLVLYGVVGGVARLLESHVGSVFVQTWEFYAITGCLFLVLAYPGYVYRYLRKPTRRVND
jgi:hypothetical protein